MRMELSKRERSTIFAIAVALVSLGALAGIMHLYEGYVQKRDAAIERAEKKKIDRTYALGEKIVLDARKDEEPLSTGRAYTAAFSWTGELDITVKRARLYDSGARLLQDLDEDLEWVSNLKRERIAKLKASDGKQRYVLLDVAIDNVSAVPSGVGTQRGMPWLNISFVQLSSNGHTMELAGFSGMPENGSREYGEGSYFDLKPHTSATYQLVYEIDGEERPKDLYLFMGVAYVPYKYHIDLNGIEVVTA